MTSFDNIIVGAGAAGLFLAGELKNYKNLIIEKNKTPGKKIIISGGGRCNFTNLEISAKDYQSTDNHFHRGVLLNYPSKKFIELVKEEKIKFYEKKLGQLFCENSSKEILNLLLKRISQQTKFIYGCEVTNSNIKKIENGFELNIKGRIYHTKNLIIASGGPPMPAIGGTNFSIQLANKFNIKVSSFRAALVPIFQKATNSLSGISLPVEIKIKKKVIKDDLLFTHKGLSGPAILKMTLWAEIGDSFLINWDPEKIIQQELQNPTNLNHLKVLKKLFPPKVIEYFNTRLNNAFSKHSLNRKEINSLIELIYRDNYLYQNNEGYRKAEVAKGGVLTKELNRGSMESDKIKGLYFIGEAVDVTGLLGGYNFQWAWASAFLTAQHIKKTSSSFYNEEFPNT